MTEVAPDERAAQLRVEQLTRRIAVLRERGAELAARYDRLEQVHRIHGQGKAMDSGVVVEVDDRGDLMAVSLSRSVVRNLSGAAIAAAVTDAYAAARAARTDRIREILGEPDPQVLTDPIGNLLGLVPELAVLLSGGDAPREVLGE